MDIPKILKELRIQNELSQQQVANILGITRTSYNRYEVGNRQIPIEILVKIADHYDITLDYLCGRKDC